MNYYQHCRDGDLKGIYNYIDTSWNDIDTVSKSCGLLIACKAKHDTCMLVLLENGVSPNIVMDNKTINKITQSNTDEMINFLYHLNITKDYCPFMLACKNGYRKTIIYLLKYGADVNKTTVTGITALMYACEILPFRYVSLLLQNGANVHQVSDMGNTALEYAIKGKRDNNIIILLKYGAHFTKYKCAKNEKLSEIVNEIENEMMYNNRTLLNYMNKDIVDNVIMKYLCCMERQCVTSYKHV
jgi:ankyrin repeat protein